MNLRRLRLSVLIAALCLSGCSAKHVDEIKDNAERVWTANGFEIVGYEGYLWGSFGQWGGCVYYVVTRNGVTYNGCISKWGDEFHIYSLTALDAVKGGK